MAVLRGVAHLTALSRDVGPSRGQVEGRPAILLRQRAAAFDRGGDVLPAVMCVKLSAQGPAAVERQQSDALQVGGAVLQAPGAPEHAIDPVEVPPQVEPVDGGCPESRGTWVAIRGEPYAATPTFSGAWAVACGWAWRCRAATRSGICL